MGLRASSSLYVEWVEDEAVVLDTGTQQIHHLNPPAALVLALVQELGYDDALVELRHRVIGDEKLDEELPALIEQLKEMGILIDA